MTHHRTPAPGMVSHQRRLLTLPRAPCGSQNYVIASYVRAFHPIPIVCVPFQNTHFRQPEMMGKVRATRILRRSLTSMKGVLSNSSSFFLVARRLNSILKVEIKVKIMWKTGTSVHLARSRTLSRAMFYTLMECIMRTRGV